LFGSQKGLAEMQTDTLLQALSSCETRLNYWIHSSEANLLLFREDPIAALRIANLGLDEALLCELEAVTDSIAEKLAAA
jgi:hypothetical protein